MWKLRQFFEGDTRISIEGISAGCWSPGESPIAANTVAIKIDGVVHTVTNGNVGIDVMTIILPSGTAIGPTTTIQVYATCVDTPETKTLIVTASPVNFKVVNGTVTSCTPQVSLTSGYDEYIRFFFIRDLGEYFTAKIDGAVLNVSNFNVSTGTAGFITSPNGVFTRVQTDTTYDTLISKLVYDTPNTLELTVLTKQYFSMRLGYIEVVFTGTNVELIDYLQSGSVETFPDYSINDKFSIESVAGSYVIKKNGVVFSTKSKNINYTVTGGSVSPSSSTVGTPVVWTLPTQVGSYTFTATLGESLIFKKVVGLHSCAQAIDDNFTGVTNTPYVGNVGTNDTKCVGENTYYEKVGVTGATNEGVGTLQFNQDGTFTFTPPTNFNSAVTFSYNIRCGATYETSEITGTALVKIDYFNACAGVVANWVDTGNVRCTNCVEEKERRDTNSQCTGNQTGWVLNPLGNACNSAANLVRTPTAPRCQDCVSQVEVQDMNTCSPTYQGKSWITGGEACNTTPSWGDTGVFECQECIEKKQQKDSNTCSPTFNTTRWENNPTGSQCSRDAIWENLNEFLCINCVENRKQIDSNVCSPTYRQKRDVLYPEGNICNTLPTWTDTGRTRCTLGVHQKEQMSSNPCSTEQSRWVDTGLELCSCTAQQFFKNTCVDEEIIGVVVKKKNTEEDSRLLSYSNGVVTYLLDNGEHDYVIDITRRGPHGEILNTKLVINNKKCNPLV